MEERLFTDWSSIDSPRERVTQCNQSARSAEPNITVIQTEQPTIGLAGNEVLGNTLSDVMTISSTHQQSSQVVTRLVDRETNMSEVEIRPQREEMSIDLKQTHSKGVQVPTSYSDLSSHDIDLVGDSSARPHIPDIMPQLDDPTSICAREDLYKSLFKEQPQCLEEDILMRVIVTHMVIDHMMNEDTLDGEDIIMIEVEGHQIEEMTKIEVIQVIQEVEGHQTENPLMMVDPLMMQDPLMMEDPQEMEDL